MSSLIKYLLIVQFIVFSIASFGQIERIVEIIRRKKGTIYTCIPCDGEKTPIQLVLKPYIF